MKQDDKQVQYSIKILSALQVLFDADNDNYIGKKELMEDDNLTEFFHALANIAPNRIFNELTGDEKNNLEFNHIANHLVFQFATKEE